MATGLVLNSESIKRSPLSSAIRLEGYPMIEACAPELHITEALPEGEDRAWITLSDGLTRLVSLRPLMQLPTHRSLRFRRVSRHPGVSPTGNHVVWRGGVLLDVASIEYAPAGPLPLTLLALIPEAQRYRPLAALLRACEPPASNYLDVRPAHVITTRWGLRTRELDRILTGHQPVSSEQVMPRLSDLSLLFELLVPTELIGGLLRRPWPYAHRHVPYHPSLDSAVGCLCAGRIDLLEAPLLHLLWTKPNHMPAE